MSTFKYALLSFALLQLACGQQEQKLSSFELLIDYDENAQSRATVQITLFWNNEIYETTMWSPPASGPQVFYADETFTYNDYNLNPSPDKAQMIIQQNDNGDSAIFSAVKITLNDGTYYGVQSFCAQSADMGSYYDNLLVDIPNQCDDPSMTNYRAVCVSHAPDTKCNPSNLIIYFDKRYPNEMIHNGLIGDAAGIFIEGCQLVVTPVVARKCARKTPDDCTRADDCALVTNEIGAPGSYSEAYEAMEFYNSHIQLANNSSIMNRDVLLLLIAISVITNIYFTFCRYKNKKEGKKTENYGSVITPLLTNNL